MIAIKAQAWGFDLMIATALFLGGIIIFYIYSINYPIEGKKSFEELYYEGSVILDSLLSEGFPSDWNAINVVRIGILDDEKVNETKLERFYNLNNSDYQKTKSLFNTKYEYYFNFSEPITLSSNGQVISGIGFEPISTSTTNLVKITRVSIYKNKPVSVNLQVWE